MENLLNQIIISTDLIGLSIVLLILGNILKNTPSIPRYLILWIIMITSVFLSLISNFSFHSLMESFIASSLANMYYQIYKQTQKLLHNLPSSKSKVN